MITRRKEDSRSLSREVARRLLQVQDRLQRVTGRRHLDAGTVTAPVAMEPPVEEKTEAGFKSVKPLMDDLAALGSEIFDTMAVTALLESTGLRDVDAREQYGYADLFALAAATTPTENTLPAPEAAPEERTPLRQLIRSFAGRYGIALAYMLPVSAQILLFVLLGYSLWAWGGFTASQATVVGLATVISLVVTAPFVQVVAARGAYYRQYENMHLVLREVRRVTGLGIVCSFAAANGTALLWWWAGGQNALWFLVYFSLLACFWLAIACIDVAQMRWMVFPVSAMGVMVVYFLHQQHGWTVVRGQWFALAAVSGFLFTVTTLKLRYAAHKTQVARRRVPLLPLRVLLVRMWPVMGYGFAYYLFLFTDRIVAWTARPLPAGGRINFRSDYEAGLDWALVVLLLSISPLEHTIFAFAKRMLPVASTSRADDDKAYARRFRRLYVQQGLLLITIAVAALMLAYLALNLLPLTGHEGRAAVFGEATSRRVFLLGGEGYVCFAAGLYFAVFLQSLACRSSVVRWLLAAVVADVVVGLITSRTYGYEWADVGMIAGAVIFALGCCYSSLRALRQGPYRLAAALA